MELKEIVRSGFIEIGELKLSHRTGNVWLAIDANGDIWTYSGARPVSGYFGWGINGPHCSVGHNVGFINLGLFPSLYWELCCWSISEVLSHVE